MECRSPFEVKEVLFQRNYKGYIYRRELIDDSEYGGDGDLEMINCYTPETGDWIGDSKAARFLCNKCNLTNIQKIKQEHCVCSIGFNEEEQKWYGWSHRAIYGFGIGSVVKKGDCGYIPKDKKDSIDDGILFWTEPDHLNVRAANEDIIDGYKGIWIEWDYSNKVKNKELRDKISGTFWCFPEVYGKGAWKAETLDDVKQMAIDFAEGVS